MFYIIGIGTKPKHLSLEASETIKKCKKVFLENYTSIFAEGNKKELEKIIKKNITELNRKKIEEEINQLVEKAKNANICLLVGGNPLIATTHNSIIMQAKKQGIQVKIIPGISIIDFVTLTGLSFYKFGKTISIVFPEKNYSPDSFFKSIEKNNSIGLHTLCLLDIKKEQNKYMNIQEALNILKNIAKEKKSKILKKNLIIGIARAGAKNMKIASGKLEKIINTDFGKTPHAIIICSELNFNEKEMLKEIEKK